MKLSNILFEVNIDFKVTRINISYTDYGQFYGLYLYDGVVNPNTGFANWREKLRFSGDAQEYVMQKTGLELPRMYDITQLDKIVDAFRKKGIEADHDDAMDVS